MGNYNKNNIIKKRMLNKILELIDESQFIAHLNSNNKLCIIITINFIMK